MKGNTLLFGADYEGVLWFVPDTLAPVMAVRMPHQHVSELHELPVRVVRIVFLPRLYAVCGVRLQLHVEHGWPEERLEAQMLACLLSDTAKAVIRP